MVLPDASALPPQRWWMVPTNPVGREAASRIERRKKVEVVFPLVPTTPNNCKRAAGSW